MIDSQGRPIETRIYWNQGGSWRRLYNGMIGEIRNYSGNPMVDFDTNGLGYPPGAHAGTYDGWHLCNGKDGVPDLSDRFIIGAHMNNNAVAGYQPDNGGWVSTEVNTAGEHSGGFREITLDTTNTYREQWGPIYPGTFTANGNVAQAGGDLWGTGNQFPAQMQGSPSHPVGNEHPNPINIIPVYLAYAFIIFVGYS